MLQCKNKYNSDRFISLCVFVPPMPVFEPTDLELSVTTEIYAAAKLYGTHNND